MQSDIVSSDPCSENVESGELNGGAVDETLVQEQGLGGDIESEDMEVDFVGERLSRPGSENLDNYRAEGGSLKGEMGSDNDGMNVVEEGVISDVPIENERTILGKNLVAVNQDNSVKANFNSFAQKLFPNPVNVDRFGKEVEAEKSVDVKNRRVEVNQAAVSEKEECKVDVDGGGFSEHKKGVSLVVGKKNGKNKGGFSVSDLVWGKVRSHPWWPAQIFEPGDASVKAKKYFKSKAYFVGYFGDQTFAWNDEAKLKPFAPNFSQMVKQTQLEAFRHAVNCVLHETSRRVEFGLSCHCIADDVYNLLKAQVIENDGIREESRIRKGGDRFFTASSFEPVKYLDYVKDLAQGPHADIDRLEHVIARAQMACFYRWKGIYHLADFGSLIGYVNNEADAPVTAVKEKREGITDGTHLPGTTEEDDTNPQKRKKIYGDNSGHSSKKVRCLSDLIRKKSIRKKDAEETKSKAGSKSISSSAMKRKEVKSLSNDSRTKECRHMGTTTQLKDAKPSFRVGESILRVAGQLGQPSPLLKHDVSSHGKAIENEGNNKHCGKNSSEYASLDVILSELYLAAIEPLKELSLLSKMVTFISNFRNSIVPDNELLQNLEECGEEDTSGSPKEELSGSGPAEMDAEGYLSCTKSKSKVSESEITTSDFEAVEDACCRNKTIRAIAQQTSLSNVKLTVVEPEHSEVDGISVCSQEMDSTLSSPQQHDGSENVASDRGLFGKKMRQEDSLTALTLKFTDMDSIPTEAKLIKIFSQFGPLKETETEVLAKKHCARVVFKRRSDAETAFSSSGKFEIFGSSLVCYRLNYAPSPRKSPSVEAKRRKKD